MHKALWLWLADSITVIYRTVMRTFQDLEVQYNVSGIIVNLAMEEEHLWLPIQQPSKDYLLDQVVS